MLRPSDEAERMLRALSDASVPVKESATTLTRLSALSAYLALCEEALESSEKEVRYGVFHEASYLFAGAARPWIPVIWDWLEEKARDATAERQQNMSVAIFELVPDPPVRWADLFRLWDMWFDPRTRCAVYSAYFLFPRRIHSHLSRYCAHRKRHRLPVPDFSEDEFHRWLEANRA